MIKSKKGFSAFDLSAEVNSSPPEMKTTASKAKPKKPVKQEKVQRAIYFPKDLDEDLRRWVYEDNTQVTKLVVQAVREFGERRKKQ